MKSKYTYYSSFLIIFMLFLLPVLPLFAQYDDEEDYYEDEELPQNSASMIFVNAGYGQYEYSAGLGFRYGLGDSPLGIGIMAGLSGFTRTLPAYSRNEYLQYYEVDHLEKYSKLVLSFDAMFFVQLNKKLSGFINLGAYSKNDSILAQSNKVEIGVRALYSRYDSRWGEASKTEWGLGYGLGFQYFFKDQIGCGVGYHHKHGFYIQLGYYWM